MRDVVTGFYVNTLNRLIKEGAISITDSVLVICGGPLDQKVMQEVGFTNFNVSNLDNGMATNRQDAENLSYKDAEFDVVIAHAGLHHCYSPHRAVLEMYRVARKYAIGFEARDSFMMRTAVRLGLTMDYEITIVDGKVVRDGGVADTGVPNFIYRWTERDVFKTIASFHPSRIPAIRYFYDLRIPTQRWTSSGSWLRFVALPIIAVSKVIGWIAPRQCNEFAFVIAKDTALQPWMDDDGHHRVLSDASLKKQG